MSTYNNPCLSVVIANFNNGKFLNKCLDSIIYSNYLNLEVIIIDDGSTDNSKVNIESKRTDLQKRCNGNVNIIYLVTNVGSGRAKAQALNFVSGNYCCFVDSDDYVHKDAFSKCIIKFSSDYHLALVYTNAIKIDASNNKLGLLNYAKDGIDMLHDKVGFHLAVWSMEHYKKLKERFNAKLQIAYDIDLYMKLEEVGNTYFIDEPLYYYRVHDNNISIGFDKLGNAYAERVISRWEAQKRRNLDNIKFLGDELQSVFNKIKEQNLSKKNILKRVIHKIMRSTHKLLNK